MHVTRWNEEGGWAISDISPGSLKLICFLFVFLFYFCGCVSVILTDGKEDGGSWYIWCYCLDLCKGTTFAFHRQCPYGEKTNTILE